MKLDLATITSTPTKDPGRDRDRERDERDLRAAERGDDGLHEGLLDDSVFDFKDIPSDAEQSIERGQERGHDVSGALGESRHEEEHRMEEEEEEEEREHVPKDLLRWRHAVANCVNASRLMVLLLQLNDCIAWEKSIMKVVSVSSDSLKNSESQFWCAAVKILDQKFTSQTYFLQTVHQRVSI